MTPRIHNNLSIQTPWVQIPTVASGCKFKSWATTLKDVHALGSSLDDWQDTCTFKLLYSAKGQWLTYRGRDVVKEVSSLSHGPRGQGFKSQDQPQFSHKNLFHEMDVFHSCQFSHHSFLPEPFPFPSSFSSSPSECKITQVTHRFFLSSDSRL